MPRWSRIVLLALAALAVALWWSGREGPAPGDGAPQGPASVGARDGGPHPSFLPPEAVATLDAIERGGPFRYDRDGSVFQNRERRLPERPRGYYREYTVGTPGAHDRGARRIVSGGDPPEVYYYTDDHYRSFRRIEVEP
jgi:guanyl-specific ribonuclease Sa